MPLNKVKENSNMYQGWITHTWNVIKGTCYHGCSYCHPARTQIMMSDFTHKNIEDINIGDEIIGIKKENGKGFYKFTKTNVVHLSTRLSKTLKIDTKNGTLICTPEHPLMGSTEKRNCSDWKYAKSFTPYENLRFISSKSRGFYSYELRHGYIKGIIDGDGCIFKHYNKDRKEYLGFEIVCIDEQLRLRIKNEFKSLFEISLRESIKRANKNSYGNDCIMLTTRKSKDVEYLRDKTIFRINKEFAKGYIAGMIDTDGSIGKNGAIRISQSETVNRIKYNNIVDCCKLLDLNFIEEKNCIRIKSSFNTKMEILFNYGIFHSKKSDRLILGNTIKGSTHSQIKSITALGKMKVYNLQTESENFIANGFIVHNCYMKRWGKLKPVRFDEKELKIDLGKENFIFVGSSCDMFANRIKPEWIIKILQYCETFDNNYLFQTKNPKAFSDYAVFIASLYDITLCTTIETNRWYPKFMGNTLKPLDRALEMSKIPYLSKFVTIEPIMDFDLDIFIFWLKGIMATQINIGADSGHNNLPEPSKEKVLELISELGKFTKVKLKSNLNRIIK